MKMMKMDNKKVEPQTVAVASVTLSAETTRYELRVVIVPTDDVHPMVEIQKWIVKGSEEHRGRGGLRMGLQAARELREALAVLDGWQQELRGALAESK